MYPLQAFSPVTTMMALYLAGVESPTRRLAAAVTIIAAGTAAAVYGEGNSSWTGLACMAAAEVAEAIKTVLTQIVLAQDKVHPGLQLSWSSTSAA